MCGRPECKNGVEHGAAQISGNVALPRGLREEILIRYVENALEGVEFAIADAAQICIGIAADDDIHFLDAAPGGTPEQALAPRFKLNVEDVMVLRL